ncbi:MAG: hypothetical protein ACR2L8_04485 [Solirubrobacteraceae bacterium]
MTDPIPHVLLVANRTCPCPDVLDDVRRRAGDGGRVRIVAPALNSRVRHWVSDVDGAVDAARDRLAQAVEWLGAEGVEAAGEVGDADPLLAIADVLASFPATVVVISTHPPERSNWLERDLVNRTEERFGLPVEHLVSRYDLAAA